MQRYNILWADDEIELLKPHILLLRNRGYEVTAVNSGVDALDEVADNNFDIIFLDEHMPGKTGLETLEELKKIKPHVPVVMITKSEEENIMEQAIGAKIADYLIKPFNPNQILLSIKKILDNKRLISEKTNLGYQQQFRELSMTLNDPLDYKSWIEIYKQLVFWELEIDSSGDDQMKEILLMQKEEANKVFFKFIEKEYTSWLTDPDIERPVLSHQLVKKYVFPELEKKAPVFFILIDNLRYDQWKILEPMIAQYFHVEKEDFFYSILPTTTGYSRNSIFSGLLPSEIARRYPKLWVDEIEEETKNQYESELLLRNIERNGLNIKSQYHKIFNSHQGKNAINKFSDLLNYELNAFVFNFVDILSHARTDTRMVRELTPDESAYRSITKSWFEHSSLSDLLIKISENGGKVILTTDHGTVRVKKPSKIIGDKTTNSNLRYKLGKVLNYDTKADLMVVKNPEKIGLPKPNVSTSYVFASEDIFFVYPNNYNYYVSYYKDTFQHGGISLEEMIVPVISLNSKNA